MPDDLGRYIEPVAEALFGKPTSRKSDELRYGKNGSLKINLKTGFWDDWEAGQSGGVLALIEREKGLKNGEAIDWMRSTLGLDIEDRRPQQRQSAPSRAPDRNPPPQDPPRDEPREQPKARPQLVKAYDYTNEAGDLVFQVCRMEPKNFLQRRKPRPDDPKEDIKGGWVWKRDGITQVPYRLPELVEALADERMIFLPEGEKDVDNVCALGVPASTNAGGAGKWPDELTPYFKDADVVVLADNDPQTRNSKTGELQWHPDGRPKLPGQDHAKLVASKLAGVAKRVRILSLPNLPVKGDATDWIEAGGTSAELYRLAESQAMTLAEYQVYLDLTFKPKAFISKFGAVMWGDPRGNRKRYEYIIKGMIPRRETVLIYGASQSGKSFFTHDMAMAVARGGDYLGRKVRRGIIVYCAAEAGDGFVDTRFAGYATGKGISENEVLPFFCLTKKFDLFGNEQQAIDLIAEIKALVAMWNQRFPDDQLELEAVVIDTFNKTTPGMDEINGKEVGLVMSRLDRIREECNCGLWLVHHMNASGTGPRGHTSLFAAFETAFRVGKYDYTLKDAPPKIRDGDRMRERRFIQNTKQREGEDGEVTDFYLRGVISSYDEDNQPVPGAVVEWIDTPASRAADKAVEEIGIALTDQRANVYRAIQRALEENGVPTPPSLGLPKSIQRVVNSRFIRPAYLKYFAAEDDSEDAIKKALSRSNDFLVRNGIIARNNPWIWITGKRIKGEQRRPEPPPEEPAPGDVVEAPDESGDEMDWSEIGDDVGEMPPPSPAVEPEFAGAME
ncbi:AAA family ATPase [Bradyrhizobium sp. Tv2a-2]|uniref:AAA family ATPase n=1 Tax=Bradyrhizobium sp. Tv2a-2 TaxID=113395 RepID=UPI0003FB26A3|nr:AAA family ATPase [Bradyrhizobium sp. Tv2a-2]